MQNCYTRHTEAMVPGKLYLPYSSYSDAQASILVMLVTQSNIIIILHMRPNSVLDMHLNPEKIGRETILVSKEAQFFVN